MSVWAIATFTLREAVRRRVVLLAGLLTVTFLAVYSVGVWFGFSDIESSLELTRAEQAMLVSFMLTGGLWSLNFMASLLAIFLAVGSISSEIDQGSIHAVLARPIRRSEVVLGKYLGYLLLMTAFVAISSGAVLAIVAGMTQYVPDRFWAAPLLIVGGAAVLIALALAGSTRLTTLGNGVAVFTLFTVGLVGGVMEQLGTLLGNAPLFDIGVLTTVLMPARAFWDMASMHVQAPGAAASQFASGPLGSLNPPSGWMLLLGGAYLLLALGAAVRLFDRRDI